MRGVVSPLLRHRARTALALACAATLAVAAPVMGAVGPERPARTVLTAQDALEQPVLRLVNRLREARGLPRLRLSESLTRAAEAHAREMGRHGYFAHESVDGTPSADRILRYYRVAGYRRWSVGENLLWRSPDVSPAQAVQMWLESPPHRHALLYPRFTEVGLAAVHVTAAGGDYSGRDVTILVADFGGRS